MSILGQMVFGAGGPRFRITGGSFSDTIATPFNPSVSYNVLNTGSETWSSSASGGGSIGNWITPTSLAGSGYDVRATVVSGTTPTGSATGSWLSLGSSQSWTLGTASVTTVTCQLTIEIRSASSLAVLASGTVTLTATKTL